jgi:hypothetical protein
MLYQAENYPNSAHLFYAPDYHNEAHLILIFTYKLLLMIWTKKISYLLFIQTQKTPNPNFLKFIPTAKIVMGADDPIDIKTPE